MELKSEAHLVRSDDEAILVAQGLATPDDRIEYIENDAVQSATESLTTSDPDKIWTVREVANWVGIGGLGPLVVGSPGQVADALQGWVEETDVDGFNLAYAVTHESFRDFVDLVVPELQRRGVYKTEYPPGTLREKLFGRDAYLHEEHQGASYRIRQEHGALT